MDAVTRDYVAHILTKLADRVHRSHTGSRFVPGTRTRSFVDCSANLLCSDARDALALVQREPYKNL